MSRLVGQRGTNIGQQLLWLLLGLILLYAVLWYASPDTAATLWTGLQNGWHSLTAGLTPAARAGGPVWR